MLMVLLLVILMDVTAGYTAVLYNATQSSLQNNDSRYTASKGLYNGDRYTFSFSRTDWSIGPHWWRVDMSPLTVYKMELCAKTSSLNKQRLEVSLYWRGAVVGTCESHSLRWPLVDSRYIRITETLTCDKVAADNVKLTLNSTKRTYLMVWEITVTGEQYYCFDKDTTNTNTPPSRTDDSQNIYTAQLYNVAQSTTYCKRYGDLPDTCYNASRGIDGDKDTRSITDRTAAGLHWWRVDMSPLRVYKVELKAFSPWPLKTEVSLHWRGSVAGTCGAYHGHSWSAIPTLTCDNVVADSVELTVINYILQTEAPSDQTLKGPLYVYDMAVSGVQYYDLDGGTVKLYNATQSTTRCNCFSTCYNASSAIDSDVTTYSLTEYTNGTTANAISPSTNKLQSSAHWLRVSMPPHKVEQVMVKAETDGVKIMVELYMEDVLVGRCQPHPGDGRACEISCDDVIADSLMLTVNSDNWTDLYVWDIKVSRVQLPGWVYVLATGLGLLGFFAILTNGFVIGFYMKKRQEAVPLMYIMIAICDSITGIVALCHSFIFTNYPAVAHILQGGYYWDTESDWFLVTVYIILQSGTRSSLFYNTVLTSVRTINITQPFHLIKKPIMILSAVVYPVLTVIVMIIATHHDTTDILSTIFMVLPGVNIAIDKQEDTTVEKRDLIMMIMMIIPLILPTIIVIICAALQIFSILKPSIFSQTTDSDRERSMTITIILLTMLCMICNIPYTVFLLYEFAVDFDLGGLSYKMLPLVFYTLCTLLPFMQALLNPTILLIRGAALRSFILETVNPFTPGPTRFEHGDNTVVTRDTDQHGTRTDTVSTRSNTAVTRYNTESSNVKRML